ncbi:MAG: cation transporter [Rhodocyclaceae bacterium]
MAADIIPPLDPRALPNIDPWQVVASLSPYLRIAHQIGGRVRLKIDASALGDPALRAVGGDRLRAALHEVRGVHAISLNMLARSCVVEYDSAVIPDAAWPDLLAGRQSLVATVLVGILQEKYEEIRRDQL